LQLKTRLVCAAATAQSGRRAGMDTTSPREPRKQMVDGGMDAASFRERGKQMVDYIADYLETIEHRRVLPEVQPGYLRDMLPNNAPTHAEDRRYGPRRLRDDDDEGVTPSEFCENV